MSYNQKEFHEKGGFNPDSAPREVLQYAGSLVKSGQRVESVNYLRAAIAQFPKDVYLHMNASVTLTKLGEEMERGGNSDAAHEYWNLSLDYALCALKTSPDDIRLLSQAGKTFRRLGEYEDSEAMYMRALYLNDRDKFTWSAMGELYTRWADQPGTEDRDDLLQDAIDCYSEAAYLDHTDELVHEKINDILSRGYCPSDDGFDPGDYDPADDDAGAIIADHEITDPADLPVIPEAPDVPPRFEVNHWSPRP